MALTKPILYSQSAFDASQTHIFNFNSIGGSQVVANQLTIVLQSTGSTVYQEKQTTYSFLHTLPANTLTNGQYYSAYIVTYDAENNTSSQSNSIQFYCYSTPEFGFNNIPASGIITNSSYSFSLTYNQNEGEKLKSYTITLYDAQRTQVSSSGTQYVGSSEIPTVVSYNFTGMSDGVNYYVQAVGVTEEGTELSTPQINIVISYIEPTIFTAVELTNNCLGGYVVVKSNLATINGISYPVPPVYIDDDTAVDVTNRNAFVQWLQGYNINSDFTASLWGREFSINEPIITLKDKMGNTLVIKYRVNEEGKHYVDLMVVNQSVKYYIYSNFLELEDDNANLQIWFRRINNLYEIGLYIVEGVI